MSPRLNDQTKERIIQMAFPKYGQAPLSASQIIKQLEKENKDAGKEIYVIPYSDRTIHAVIKKARGQETEIMEVDRQPWCLATMDKVGIPWEATGFIMQSMLDLDAIIRSGEKKPEEIWPCTFEFLTYIQDKEVQTEEAPRKSLLLTSRQARWLWRIHLVIPKWELPDWLPELCQWADEYAHREMMAEYLGQDFDTSDLDGSLRNLLRNIKQRGISAKKKKEKQITGKEE